MRWLWFRAKNSGEHSRVNSRRFTRVFSGDFTICLSPQGGDFTRDLICSKSKSPLFPGGGGAVVTNDWCINNSWFITDLLSAIFIFNWHVTELSQDTSAYIIIYNSKKLGSMHGEQRVITGLSREVKQKLFVRGCQHWSVWTGSSNILEIRNIGRTLAALSGTQHYKEQKFQNFQ